MELKDRFEMAVKESKELSSKPNNEMLLKLYSLYKQATEGDISSDAPTPGMFDFVNKAKQEAWQKLKGTSAETAMNEYIKTINELKGV